MFNSVNFFKMEINTLVTHKKLKSLGIGCVSKIMSKKLKVNFGTEDVMTCDPKMLEVIDTSGCKTIKFSDFKAKTITNGFPNGEVCVIVGNELKNYVGIGWVTKRVVTHDDLKKYPRVVD